ncbi:MAG: cobalamin B12-binding domain-containing protein [Thermoplasmata archaeon]|nr:cobalamin B12-binding domain-containing protein [Thermoplasmata archaeon]
MERKIRVLVAKPGLDGHDRGAKVVARALRDAGMEVIYLGLKRTPDEIAATAVQEDVDVIGLSILSGAHMTHFRDVLDALAARDASDIPVIGGGIIPEVHQKELISMGVKALFGPGTSTAEIVRRVREIARDREASGGA